ncbi:semaphorin-4B-like [Nematolebias whitei]|uniref:semaphorin-4B-like n=1 Tax=Nematolebias whitei TaxID=451745 RepID=UPI00189A477D|nr:semaphorin-4B-like [Nematolebias whitei]
MAPLVLLLLLSLLLSCTDSLPPPRLSFLLNSTERPLVHRSVLNTTTLLLSDDGSTLYVGAQDAVLSLDVSRSDVISLKKVAWSPSEDEIIRCGQTGKSRTVDCPNFVHVLQLINSSHLYACGSYAYNPHEAFIDIESFSVVHQGGAKGHCPFSPFERSAAVAIDGELFTATTTTFRGNEPQISRYFSKDGRPDVNLDTSVRLLKEPTFVSSSLDPAQNKLYFFFTEVGEEFSFVNEFRIPRVAQVCKDDVGGQRTLQKKWTSFAKAAVMCQKAGQLPFNLLQDVFVLGPPEGSSASETRFYGVFTSQWSTQSAVCSFSLQDVRNVFTGNYRTLNVNSHQWSPVQDRRSHLGQCGLSDSSDPELEEVKKTFLTSQSVDPKQVLVSSDQKYTRLAAMRTLAADGRLYHILFLLTETGFLHKVVLLDQGPRVIEEIQVFTQPQLVQSLVLSSSKGVLYVGSSEGVTVVPVARCSIYRTCRRCILAQDPLCVWSRSRKVCTGLDQNQNQEDIVQNLDTGSVGDKCAEDNRVAEDTEVFVHLNDAVRLPCLKPSNVATLTWTWTRAGPLPEKLFILSSDGSLSFLASSVTVSRYRCEAEEGGAKEVVASFVVRQILSPRSFQTDSTGSEEKFEEILTEEPSTGPGPEDSGTESPDGEPTTDEELKQNFTDGPKNRLTAAKGEELPAQPDGSDDGSDDRMDLLSTSRQNLHSGLRPSHEPQGEKSYYRELVVVSLLLAVSVLVLVLGSVHIWRQKKSGSGSDRLVSAEDFSKTSTALEICSLSTPEDTALGQTVSH